MVPIRIVSDEFKTVMIYIFFLSVMDIDFSSELFLFFSTIITFKTGFF